MLTLATAFHPRYGRYLQTEGYDYRRMSHCLQRGESSADAIQDGPSERGQAQKSSACVSWAMNALEGQEAIQRHSLRMKPGVGVGQRVHAGLTSWRAGVQRETHGKEQRPVRGPVR